MADKICLFLAQGFGTGRIRFAPGTWGSGIGFLWIGLLLLPGNLFIYLAGTVIGFFAAVAIGSRAEKILNQKDPSSIVLDEIVAMPVAFLGCILIPFQVTLPGVATFLDPSKWHLLAATFFLFRLFDVLKPCGIYRSQFWWGGLVVDDILAAMLVAPLVALLKYWTM